MTLGGATNYLFAVTASLLHHSLSRSLSQCHSYLREEVEGTWTEDSGNTITVYMYHNYHYHYLCMTTISQ